MSDQKPTVARIGSPQKTCLLSNELAEALRLVWPDGGGIVLPDDLKQLVDKLIAEGLTK